LGGLGWRLIVSYALVVVAAVLAFSIAATVSALSRGERQANQTSVAGLLAKNAAAAGSYLAATPSASALRYFVLVPTLQDLAGHRSPVAVAVLDPRGRILAADTCTRAAYHASSSASCRSGALSLLRPLFADPTARRLLERASRGTATSGAAAGHGFVAVPILAGGKQTGEVGALVAAFAGAVPTPPGQSGFARFWSQWKASLPRDWLWLTAITVLLATGVGALLSYRHVRRVTQIAAVARSWSRGDLAVAADASRHDELGRLAADLNQMADQLRNLLDTRSRLATEQERRRVQRDLHDGIKQELFATTMHLAAVRASLPPEQATLATALDQAQASNRRAQHELAALLEQSPSPARGNLDASLHEIAERLPLKLNCDIRLDTPLSDVIEETVYRVCQEALTNVCRHSGADTATLTLASDGTQTRLEIRDGGQGFAPMNSSRGMGLRTMRERVESIGGSLTIESGQAGTTITALLPASSE
jgi:signal transduction histidine kinase